MKFPWTTQIEALEARVAKLESILVKLAERAKQTQPEPPPQKQRLMTSGRTPSLIRKLEARDIAKMRAPGKIVRDVAKGPEPA